jgi:hypothetical protein
MSKHYETKSMHPYPSRALQQYQEHVKNHRGLRDLNMTNKQINYLPSQKDKHVKNINHAKSSHTLIEHERSFL